MIEQLTCKCEKTDAYLYTSKVTIENEPDVFAESTRKYYGYLYLPELQVGLKITFFNPSDEEYDNQKLNVFKKEIFESDKFLQQLMKKEIDLSKRTIVPVSKDFAGMIRAYSLINWNTCSEEIRKEYSEFVEETANKLFKLERKDK